MGRRVFPKQIILKLLCGRIQSIFVWPAINRQWSFLTGFHGLSLLCVSPVANPDSNHVFPQLVHSCICTFLTFNRRIQLWLSLFEQDNVTSMWHSYPCPVISPSAGQNHLFSEFTSSDVMSSGIACGYNFLLIEWTSAFSDHLSCTRGRNSHTYTSYLSQDGQGCVSGCLLLSMGLLACAHTPGRLRRFPVIVVGGRPPLSPRPSSWSSSHPSGLHFQQLVAVKLQLKVTDLTIAVCLSRRSSWKPAVKAGYELNKM